MRKCTLFKTENKGIVCYMGKFSFFSQDPRTDTSLVLLSSKEDDGFVEMTLT